MPCAAPAAQLSPEHQSPEEVCQNGVGVDPDDLVPMAPSMREKLAEVQQSAPEAWSGVLLGKLKQIKRKTHRKIKLKNAKKLNFCFDFD